MSFFRNKNVHIFEGLGMGVGVCVGGGVLQKNSPNKIEFYV